MLSHKSTWGLFLLLPLFIANCSEDGLNTIDLICETPKDCDDGDPCTIEECVPMVECRNILVEDGQICDENGVAICLDGACAESKCGDLFIDVTLGEECDDGNGFDNDGCAADCTNGKPNVTITYPERGTTIDGDTSVTILGSITDPKVGMESFTVNGENVTIQADGTFSHTLTAKHGLNFIEARALSLGGKEDSASVGFYHSSNYLAFAEVEAETTPLQNGFVYRLGQEAFDDGDHPCSTVDGVYQCDEVDDLATVGEIILNNLDAEDLGDAMTLYNQTFPFLHETLPIVLDPILLDDAGTLTISGEIGFDGDVVVNSEVVELEFNNLGLTLDARNGGLDATVTVLPDEANPGFDITIRTSVTVNASAQFNDVSALLETDWITLDSMDIICLFIPPEPPYNTICPATPGGPLAPLAGFDPSPTAWADSGLAITQMTLETGFNISTDGEGNINVALVDGSIEFHDSEIDLDVIRDLQIDLGNLLILGGVVNLDLGQIDLSMIANGLDSALDGMTGLILNDLQNALEPAIELLLLNSQDPLNVGQAVKDLIMKMGIEQDLEVPNYSNTQPNTPSLHLKSQISSLEFKAPQPNDMNTGGMTAGFGTVVSAPKNTNRDPLGMVLRDGCYGQQTDPLTFAEGQAMEAAQHLDALNQGVYAAWWDGGFNMNLKPSDSAAPIPQGSGVTDYALTVDFYTAPTFTSCTAGQPQLQVADVKVNGTYNEHGTEYTIVGYANFSLPVAWNYVDGGVAFELATTNERFFDLDIVSGTAAETDETRIEIVLESAIAEQLVSMYVARVLSAYPALSFDLAEMYGLESAATLEMTPSTYYHSNGYEVVAGATH